MLFDNVDDLQRTDFFNKMYCYKRKINKLKKTIVNKIEIYLVLPSTHKLIEVNIRR